MGIGIQIGSSLWSSLNALVRLATRFGFFSTEFLGCRVISVGNLQAGGAGKTPIVAALANEAQRRGLKVCILSRGYKGSWEKSGGTILPGDSVDAKECGDEPALLHDLCPKAFLGIGSNRVRSFRELQKKQGSFDLVLLDDGFQNRQIKKDLEIVLLTSATPSQKLYRDFFSALKYADLIVWTKGQKEKKIDSHFFGKTPIKIQFKLPPAPSPSLRYWFVTGIADGGFARDLAAQSGYVIDRHLCLEDHHVYNEDWIRDLIYRACEAGIHLLITGKDWMKWKSLGIPKQNIEVLEPEIEILEGVQEWQQVLWGKSV